MPKYFWELNAAQNPSTEAISAKCNQSENYLLKNSRIKCGGSFID
jgi:hypothetical protein